MTVFKTASKNASTSKNALALGILVKQLPDHLAWA
jgi:hypothetical protein